MKTEEELLLEVEAECPELVGSYYGRNQLGNFLMRNQEAMLVMQGEASRRLDAASAALVAREAVINKLEAVIQAVATCVEDPTTSDLSRVTTRVSLPRRVIDFIKTVDMKVSAADVERQLKEKVNYVPLSDYYRKPLVDVQALARAMWDKKEDADPTTLQNRAKMFKMSQDQSVSSAEVAGHAMGVSFDAEMKRIKGGW